MGSLSKATGGKEIVVGITGASGALLAKSVLGALVLSPEIAALDLVATKNSFRVFTDELGVTVSAVAQLLLALGIEPRPGMRVHAYNDEDIDAPIASGSHRTDGMLVIPCSAGTLGSIANGISRGLVQRAADVHLKERRTLLLAFRETPLSLVHLENLTRVTRAGAIVVPPMPAFYIGASLDDWLAHYAMRLFDLLGLESTSGALRWQGPTPPEA